MRSRRVINRGRMERVAGERCADGDDSTAGDRTAGGGALVELHVTGPVRSAVPGADTAVVLGRGGGGAGASLIPWFGGGGATQVRPVLRERGAPGVGGGQTAAPLRAGGRGCLPVLWR